jgi:hypothetical protein
MAVVAAIMSTIATTPPTTPPMMATVLPELDGIAMDILFPGPTAAVKHNRENSPVSISYNNIIGKIIDETKYISRGRLRQHG